MRYYLGYDLDSGLTSYWDTIEETVVSIKGIPSNKDTSYLERDNAFSAKVSMILGVSVVVHDDLLYRVLSSGLVNVDMSYFRGIAKGFHCNDIGLTIYLSESLRLSKSFEFNRNLTDNYSIDFSNLQSDKSLSYWYSKCKDFLPDDCSDIDLYRHSYYVALTLRIQTIYDLESSYFLSAEYNKLYLDRYKKEIDLVFSCDIDMDTRWVVRDRISSCNTVAQCLSAINMLLGDILGAGCERLLMYYCMYGRDAGTRNRVQGWLKNMFWWSKDVLFGISE